MAPIAAECFQLLVAGMLAQHADLSLALLTNKVYEGDVSTIFGQSQYILLKKAFKPTSKIPIPILLLMDVSAFTSAVATPKVPRPAPVESALQKFAAYVEKCTASVISKNDSMIVPTAMVSFTVSSVIQHCIERLSNRLSGITEEPLKKLPELFVPSPTVESDPPFLPLSSVSYELGLQIAGVKPAKVCMPRLAHK